MDIRHVMTPRRIVALREAQLISANKRRGTGKAVNHHKRNVAIGVGLGVGVLAGGVAIAIANGQKVQGGKTSYKPSQVKSGPIRPKGLKVSPHHAMSMGNVYAPAQNSAQRINRRITYGATQVPGDWQPLHNRKEVFPDVPRPVMMQEINEQQWVGTQIPSGKTTLIYHRTGGGSSGKEEQKSIIKQQKMKVLNRD